VIHHQMKTRLKTLASIVIWRWSSSISPWNIQSLRVEIRNSQEISDDPLRLKGTDFSAKNQPELPAELTRSKPKKKIRKRRSDGSKLTHRK
jgi:hypothetical protein